MAVLTRKNNALLKKYNGDNKFVRVHKRIREENVARKSRGEKPLISEYEDKVKDALSVIKLEIDQKVYDRNDILKKDAYFDQTVMQQINTGLDKLGIVNTREDRLFIQNKLSIQYMNQYRSIYTA